MSERNDMDLNELDSQPGTFDDDHDNDDESVKAVRTGRDLEAVYDIPVQVSAVLGKATMQVSQLLKLGRGAVVELDRKVGEAIDIYVNNRLVARGEVVIVDERLGVTMTEIIKSDRSA
ncbi:MAG: flagellar motor switch protein FliN [Thalassobaculales bacterium]